MDQASTLTANHTRLKKLRLQQRLRVAQSELLDHAGLAENLESTFRSWWVRWLEQQGWSTDAKQNAWPQSRKPEARAQLTPVTNSVCKRLPLWLGPLPDAERKLVEAQGQQVVALKNIQYRQVRGLSLFQTKLMGQAFLQLSLD